MNDPVSDNGRALEPLLEGVGDCVWLLDNLRDAVYICEIGPDGLPGPYLAVNDAACRALGYTREELLKHTPMSLGTPDVALEVVPRVMRTLRETGSALFESIREARDGRHVPVENHTRLIERDGRKLLLTVSREISDRKKAEAELAETARHYHALFESAHDAIFTADPETGRVIDANPAALSLIGRTREEVIGMHQTDLHPPDALSRAEDAFAASVDRAGHFSEMDVIHKDGRRIPVEISSGGLVESGGKKVHFGIFRDISGRKAAESLARRYQMAVESSEDMIAASDRDYRFIFVNRAFLDYYRFKREQVEGERIPDVIGSEAFLERVKPNLDRSLNGESVSYHVTNPYKGKGERDLDVRYFPLREPGGEVSGVVAIVRDVTEKRAADREKKELEEQLRRIQKMEAIGALAGGIAHDFNNILAPIVGFSELMWEDLPETSPLKENLEQILKATNRARDLVRQILTFSRQTEAEISSIQPHVILREVVKLVRATLPRTIRIRDLVDPHAPAVMADPTHIHQIAMNLITNAFHAMQETGGVLTLGLEKRTVPSPVPGRLKAGAYTVLSVSDTGPGMDKETLSRIFNPYFTTKPKGKGTGLGLSIVHGIVKSYNGDVFARSKPGEGSVFEVWIPALAPEPGSGTPSAVAALPGGKERILLVDDEAPVVNIVSRILRRLGYDVESRTSSLSALAAFAEDPGAFDLVVTDLTMPDMTGDRLAAEILKIRPGMPIVMCTGFSEKITPEAATERGFAGFLLKPILRAELAHLVRSALDRDK